MLTPLALLGVAVRLWWTRERSIPCRFHAITGVPCPFCGGVRAWWALMDGRLGDSLRLQPLVAFLTAGALAFVVYSALVVVLRLPRPRPRFTSRRERRAFSALAIGLLWLNWIRLW